MRKRSHKTKPIILDGLALGIAEVKSRQYLKRQLINSLGAVCALCGEPINNMKDCSIDHIIPMSKGGQTTIENCQLAHKKCNFKKGATIYET